MTKKTKDSTKLALQRILDKRVVAIAAGNKREVQLLDKIIEKFKRMIDRRD